MTERNAFCGHIAQPYNPNIRCEDLAEYGVLLSWYPYHMFMRCYSHAVAFVEDSEWSMVPIDETAEMQARMIDEKAKGDAHRRNYCPPLEFPG